MRRRDYPKTLVIGKATYTVEMVPHIHETKKRVQRGECCPNTKRIKLLETLNSVELFETFIHEVLHAIEFEGGFKIKHKTIYDLEVPLAKFIKLLMRKR